METAYLASARQIAARAFAERLRPGDSAVDATLGTGQDCLQLCRLVGDGGLVHGFDIQLAALDKTRARLLEHRLDHVARLYLAGHERMADFVPPGIRLAAFNLGWLPGSDKRVTTRAGTSVLGLQAALGLLAPGGLAVVCIYPGHEEGERERRDLLQLAAALPPRAFTALWHDFLNGGPGAPGCLLIEKCP